MANNVLNGQSTGLIALQDCTFADAGITSTNVNTVFQLPELISYKPGRGINALTEITSGKSYYVVGKADDYLDKFAPPVPTGTAPQTWESFTI